MEVKKRAEIREMERRTVKQSGGVESHAGGRHDRRLEKVFSKRKRDFPIKSKSKIK